MRMTKPRCTDSDFIELFESVGAAETARRLGINERRAFSRRRQIEQRTGRTLKSPRPHPSNLTPDTVPRAQHPGRIELSLPNGIMLVGSDAHYWPGEPSLMHRALVRFCKDLKPRIVIANGDLLDGASISRHPPQNWERVPKLSDEIEAVKERLHEIELATPRNCDLIWTLGNHDARFETRLATVAPEYAKIHGVHLHDHFPLWRSAWSAWINDEVVVKHRWKGGVHAAHNNVVGSGKTMVTGHLHSGKVTGYTDYNPDDRYGVDTGTLADTYGPQFEYMEDNPRNHRSAFGVFTFRDSRLMQPELVLKWDKNSVQFRGQVIKP